SLLTLLPFYALAVRSTVPTKESTTLHLWIPEADEVNLDAQVGNLAVFYNLDLTDLKEALGIPTTDFIGARTTLRDLSEEYGIPEEDIRSFFSGFYTYNGWRTILTDGQFIGSLGRTLLITLVSLIGLTILSVFTGYGLAGLRRRDQRVVYSTYLLQMVIPAMLILLPQFLVVQWFTRLIPGFAEPGMTRVVAQLASIVAINIKGTAFSVLIFTAFINGIPRELEESAMIDGASRMQYVWRILMPLLKAPIVALIVVQLPLIYNQFLEPFVYLDTESSTLLPYIQSTVGQFSTNFQVIYAAILASILPLMVVYIVFRKAFVKGALSGAIKG
ncbi:MAG: carbohydrate ABC transporter permease, partial [Actinomycetia bacterium]|nr:carbohydrate ABC transporter permease [Actinomycetes bacterium]